MTRPARTRPARTLPLPVVARGVGGFYRATFHPRMPLRVQRRVMDAAAVLLRPPRGTVVEPVRLGGRPAERITVGATERPRAVLYLHGGGYNSGSLRTHRALAAELAAAAGAVVWTLDYRLAPEHPYPAALDDAMAAYVDLLEQGWTPDRLAVAGDSAGGGLATALALRLAGDRGVRPAALALIAPWVDPGDRSAPQARDLVITTASSYAAADQYLGAGDPADPGYAPARGDLSLLPPTLVHVGVTEVLHGQVMRFVAAARAAGAGVAVTEQPDLWHVAHLQAAMLAEAADAVRELGEFLRERLDAGMG